MAAGTWVVPEEVAPGAEVGLAMAWFPHPQIEYNDELCGWREGNAPPPVPHDHLYGEWRPSPCYQTHLLLRNYKIVPAVAGLFPDGDFVCFYARGTDWWVPKGTPQIILLYSDTPLKAPHEPPAHLR
jgi:hypothetical protein